MVNSQTRNSVCCQDDLTPDVVPALALVSNK